MAGLELDLGPDLARDLGPHLLPELGGVELSHQVGAIANHGDHHHDDESDDADQYLLHGALMMPVEDRSGNAG